MSTSPPTSPSLSSEPNVDNGANISVTASTTGRADAALEPSTDALTALRVDGSPPPAATPGEMLKRAREATGLTVGDIAARLRMGVKQVHALEMADYASLPTGTFLRGLMHIGQNKNCITLIKRT